MIEKEEEGRNMEGVGRRRRMKKPTNKVNDGIIEEEAERNKVPEQDKLN